MHLNIFVSPKCFLYCKGCYSISREEDYNKFIDTNKLIEFLKFIYNSGVRKVTLCGGDPLTRNDILKLLEQIKSIGFFVSLDTVGTSIIKNIEKDGKIIIEQIDVKKLSKLVDVIGIPIDGSTNEIFKLFRQTNRNILEEQLLICNELHKYNANICINTVVHKRNLCDAYNLVEIIKKLDYIKKWQIFQFMPIGKVGNKNRNIFEITNEQFLQFKSDVLNNFNESDIDLQFKSSDSRNKSYVLVDNSGNAWISYYDIGFNEKRVLIGNILNYGDWNKISSYLDKR